MESYTIKNFKYNDILELFKNDDFKNSFINIIGKWGYSMTTLNNHKNTFKNFSVILHNNKIVSIAITGNTEFFGIEQFEPYIHSVKTLDEYSGKGLCKKVIENLVHSYWDDTNIELKNIRLEVAPDNTGAHKCYLAIGFKYLRLAKDTDSRYDWMEIDTKSYLNYLIKKYLLLLVEESSKINPLTISSNYYEYTEKLNRYLIKNI